MTPRVPRTGARVLAALFVLASGADRLRFAAVDQAWVPQGDDGAMVTVATQRFALLSDGLWAALTRPVTTGAPYPPLVALVGGATADATGWGMWGLLASQAIWAWVGAGAAMAAGEATGGAAGGLLGATLWVWMTQGTAMGDHFFAEPALGALGLLVLVLLERSRGMRSVPAAAGAGVAAGLGLLAKFTFAAYIGPVAALWSAGSAMGAVARGRGPGWLRAGAAIALLAALSTAMACIASWAKAGTHWGDLQVALGVSAAIFLAMVRPKDWRVGAGVVAFAVLAGTVAGAWYVPNRGALREFLSNNNDRQYVGDPLPWSLALAYYGRVVLRDTLDTPGLVLVVLGAARSLWRPVPIGLLGLFAAATSLALLAAAPYQNERYVAPAAALLVPVALAAVPVRALPFAAALSTLASAFLLTTRLPDVHAWVARSAHLRRYETRIGQEAQSIAYERSRVEALVTRSWLPLPLQVTLRPPDPSPSPLLQAFRGAASLCPPGVPLRLVWSSNDLGMPLTSLSAWEPHPPWVIARPQPGDEVTLVVGLASAQSTPLDGPYRVTVEPADARCPGGWP